MPDFSPAGYLRGLGWSGPGSSLNNSPTARTKPVTVAQKKTLSGVGKDRDTAFPWWEMVFSAVANKAVSGDKKEDHHRTETGIISPRPPPPKGSAYDSMSATSEAGSSRLNLSAFAEAKREAARRQLYSGFLRGAAIGGSADEVAQEGPPLKNAGEKQKQKKEKKDRKGKGKEMDDIPTPSETPSSDEREQKKDKKDRKKRKRLESETETPQLSESDADLVIVSHADSVPTSVSVLASFPSPPTSNPSTTERKKKRRKEESLEHLSPEEQRAKDEEAYQEARLIAKRARKEERRLEKVIRRALNEEKKTST
ncbi:hypothetical protein T439DRAFT_327081 [Meredithblackwellia eburnea MCA 4105]